MKATRLTQCDRRLNFGKNPRHFLTAAARRAPDQIFLIRLVFSFLKIIIDNLQRSREWLAKQFPFAQFLPELLHCFEFELIGADKTSVGHICDSAESAEFFKSFVLFFLELLQHNLQSRRKSLGYLFPSFQLLLKPKHDPGCARCRANHALHSLRRLHSRLNVINYNGRRMCPMAYGFLFLQTGWMKQCLYLFRTKINNKLTYNCGVSMTSSNSHSAKQNGTLCQQSRFDNWILAMKSHYWWGRTTDEVTPLMKSHYCELLRWSKLLS